MREEPLLESALALSQHLARYEGPLSFSWLPHIAS